MTVKLPKFTLRIDSELLKKFHYIARYNAHSSNREIELFVRKHVEKFERKYNKIALKQLAFLPTEYQRNCIIKFNFFLLRVPTQKHAAALAIPPFRI